MLMEFNKPRFNWEARDWLSELEQFKQECSVLFDGPLVRNERSAESRDDYQLDWEAVYHDLKLNGYHSGQTQ